MYHSPPIVTVEVARLKSGSANNGEQHAGNTIALPEAEVSRLYEIEVRYGFLEDDLKSEKEKRVAAEKQVTPSFPLSHPPLYCISFPRNK